MYWPITLHYSAEKSHYITLQRRRREILTITLHYRLALGPCYDQGRPDTIYFASSIYAFMQIINTPNPVCNVLAGGRLENLAVNGLHYSQKKSHYITLQPEKVGLHYITGPKSHITLHYRRPL